MLSELYRKRREFYRAREQVNMTIKEATNSLGYIESLSSRVGEVYSINDEGADNNYLLKRVNKLKETIYYMSNTVISNIDNAIERINREIERLLEEEDD